MLSVISCGDLELNVAHPQGTPTLVPSPGLEQRLDVRLEPLASEATAPLRLAIHLHIYYQDTLQPLLEHLQHCQPGLGVFDLWVSTDSSAKAETLTRVIQHSPLMRSVRALRVQVCPNRGRNLGPLLLTLWPDLQHYDLLLHLHGKRSVETELGDDWLQQLLTTLLPGPAQVQDLLQRWAGQPRLGLVMPQPPALIRPYLNWGSNFELARLLAQRLRSQPLHRQAVLLFPAGVMFWCRPQALKPLAELAAHLEELPPEPLGVDGSSLHTLERLVGHACEASGLRWRLICRKANSSAETGLPLEPAELSLWEPRKDDYLQATGLLAARAREETERRLCCEQNLANATDQLERHMASAELQLGDADQQLQNADADIRRLMQEVSERDQRLHHLQSSVSWRLTAPLRLVLRLWRRMRPGPAGT
jgi:lipopolysaccharide biosynthesis protein